MTSVSTLLSQVLQFDTDNRRSFPWRQSYDPYHVLVSEYMLQQTQTGRVVEAFSNFLSRFPSVHDLASAKRQDVLACWVGLGYNRRAVALQNTAKLLVSEHDGIVPSDEEALRSLPGIGPYTAAAIVIFAYNKRAIAIETNIRTVVVHHCMHGESDVSDTSIATVMERLLSEAERRSLAYRDLYAALMDYGAHLKRSGIRVSCRNTSSQGTFKGSVRQARGVIIKTLVSGTCSVTDRHIVPCTRQTWEQALSGLIRDGMIEKSGGGYVLCGESAT
ncbi:MAG: A/G-specific adenine glycosylase [Candidatus Kaiserbacteria bacterium]|nr:A/G-specific adenine glycosylase [Candidatus Kaiserbacteria bacterium]